jgi:uncharacterized SAM-binding protein YcdF (DUF218 family)
MTEREKFIILVDNDIVKKSDAIIFLEGDGLTRISKTIELYKQQLADCIIFSGNIVNYEYGSYPFDDILPELLQNGIPAASVLFENKSLNTHEQAIEVIQLAVKNSWKKLILVGTHYHQYRAYLTFLKEVLNTNSEIIIYNAPANTKWFTNDGWGKRFDLLEQEFIRIENYSKLNHLATYNEAIEYQLWKEQQA